MSFPFRRLTSPLLAACAALLLALPAQAQNTAADKPADRPIDRPIDRPVDAPADKPADKLPEQAPEKAPEKAADKVADEAPTHSAMDAPLFYQLLIGEIELRNGQPGVAFQVLLDGARRTGDDALFRRAINVAIQARAGDEALRAARAWRETVPTSAEAAQTTVQLLALLNRPADVPEPLGAWLRLSSAEQRPAVLASMPRLFQRSPEPKRVLEALSPLLQLQIGALKPAALFTEARLSIMAGENARAMRLTRELAQAAPDSDDALQLALELMPSQPEAESLITARLQARPDQHLLRQAYGRALARAQRPADAAAQFRLLTEATPGDASAWLTLGALEVELRHAEAADSALQQALKLLDAAPRPAGEEGAGPVAQQVQQQVQQQGEMRKQAWLMLSQAAEQRGDLNGAEGWLSKVEGNGLDVRYRRASLMARQGRVAEARKLLQAPAGASDAEARQHLLAQSQLMRDLRDWKGSLAVLQSGNDRFKDDPDLLYEQAMMTERLGRFDEMEALLRKVIAIKPDHQHAYNALGYSLADRNIRLPEAKQLIERALQLAPGEPFIIDSLGWVEYRLGNLPEAARLLRQAHAARPDAEIAAHLGEVLWAQGERDEARRVWREAAARDPKNDALRETQERLKVGP